MRKIIPPSIFVALLLSVPSVHADQTPPSGDILDDVRVILPYGGGISELQQTPAPLAVPDSMRQIVSLDVSSWAPSNLTLASHLQNASAFQTAGVPYLSASFATSPLLHGSAGTLSLRTGVGFLRLTRDGTVDVPGAPQTYSQTAYLIPVELGLEARPSFLQWRKVGFYFDAGVLPTLMLTERSPFDDGRTLIGLPVRFLVGGTYDVRGLLPITQPTYFELGVSSTVGSVSEGNMNGTGILAGVRVAI